MLSKRQEGKKARGGSGLSRPNRRAAKRLAVALAGYEAACKVSKNAAAYTKPGAQKKW